MRLRVAAMNKLNLKKILSVIVCAALSAAFIVIMYFCAPTVSEVGESNGIISDMTRTEDGGVEEITYEVGKDLTAVRICDLTELGKLTKVNYVADDFVPPGKVSKSMQIVDLTKPYRFAEKGTLIFVIMNIDPASENFYELSEALSEYKIGENWRFTLSLPKIYCASNVYLNSKLIARHGEIENYDFIEFNTSYDKKTEKFNAYIEPTLIDLNFYTRREAISNRLASAEVITVHYQSTGGAYSGITEYPLIGTEKAVKSITENSENLLIAFGILAAVVLAVLIVMSLLKRTNEFMPAFLWIFGIALLLLSRFILARSTSVPLLCVAVWLASSFIILCGTLLAVGRNFGKAPAKYIAAALAGVGALLAFICPFVPFGAAQGLKIACTVIKAACAALLAVFIGFSFYGKSGSQEIFKTICAAVIFVAITASLFMPQVYPAYSNPIFWLCAATLALTFVSVFMVFNETEKENAYLTGNLHLEVERQIKDIRAVIAERDNLLQFVSHDMKKPLVSSEALIDTLIERENDGEQVKALRIVKQNTARVISNLSEIGSYARFNYIAEPSQVVDLYELCASVYDFHYPDCNANGIILKNLAERHCKVYVKRQGLENAVSNIILNAVEHSECKTITFSVKSVKNKAVLSIADDGKGINTDEDVFKAYVSGSKPETGGVGLYICRNIIESMNGTLTYESGNGGTVFRISLLKA